ncbi:lytic murein transglycosylase [Rhodoferax sp. U11-2br]|uniref:lytic murein transglycosylase n=1 Tax=Rhodoferax sp. U11-2br TaxID=2838878 RepID=UPI001BE845F5|nr:lytic murein transglycosylase [Rhodoferax sp. U11-2br]MBT3066445.1 lytic murein transglycosylase [Rhodoferax sp. U11-2br]
MNTLLRSTASCAPSSRWLSPLLACLALAACTTPPLPTEPKTAAPALQTTAANAEPADLDVHAQQFAHWVAEFSQSARTASVDEATLHRAFDTVRFVPRVIELDRAQPEFNRTVWDYLDNAVSKQRVTRGQDKLQQSRADINAAASRYGVPAEILVAIWGMESNYGSFMGDIPSIDALATLGFEGRRGPWARGQLLAALKMLQNHEVERSQMLGSWAGAMGQTQLLPSNYLAYAVDADGDGRRDIWASLPDVMGTTAHFLAKSGWQVNQPWAVEVRLPAGFDLARADGELRQSSAAWQQQGVLSLDSRPLPELPDAAILLTAGARGPAFLVGANFRAILRYNNATSYALAVGLLAQQLAGGPGVQTPWPRDVQALSRTQLLALQAALSAHGFDSGPPDGVMGPATRRAIRAYQRSVGLPQDGYPTLDLLTKLQ